MSAAGERLFIVYGFASTHDALDAEALLDDMGIDVVPIPAPASVSATCGIALRVEVADAERAERYLSNAEITVVVRAEITDR